MSEFHHIRFLKDCILTDKRVAEDTERSRPDPRRWVGRRGVNVIIDIVAVGLVKI